MSLSSSHPFVVRFVFYVRLVFVLFLYTFLLHRLSVLVTLSRRFTVVRGRFVFAVNSAVNCID